MSRCCPSEPANAAAAGASTRVKSQASTDRTTLLFTGVLRTDALLLKMYTRIQILLLLVDTAPEIWPALLSHRSSAQDRNVPLLLMDAIYSSAY